MATIDVTTQYFNVWDILQYEVVGSEVLLILLGAVILAYVIARYSVPYQAGIGMMLIYLLVASVIAYNWSFYVIAITLIGVVSYSLIAKIFQRG